MTIGINADSSTIGGNLQVLEKLLERFCEAGFSAVEIPVHGVGCILGGKLRNEQTEKVRRILERYPFAYTVHGPDPVNLADAMDPETHAEALCSTIDFAAAIGSTVVVYHGSYRAEGSNHFICLTQPPRSVPVGERRETKTDGYSASPTARSNRSPSPESPQPQGTFQEGVAAWEDELERLERIGSYAGRQGVTLAVENIFRQGDEETYRIDPRLLSEVVEAVGSPHVGICFDFGHGYLSSQEEGFSYRESVQAVLPHLVHVHIHDNLGVPVKESLKPIDALVLGVGDLHLPPGWGKVPYREVLGEVLSSYRGVLMLEIHPQFADSYEEAIQWVKGWQPN